MRSIQYVLAAVAVVNAASVPEPGYSVTPFGHILSRCVHEIPSGSATEELANGDTVVTPPSGAKYTIPKCDTSKYPLRRPKPASFQRIGGTPLPPDYDGWLQYTALNITMVGLAGGFDAFTNVMSVPDLPSAEPQQLFLFPGLQNTNWIPKVDPEPSSSNPFDIIQPVLQYPAGFFKRGWGLKSWYVTVNAGAIFSSEIDNIQAGDSIFCNMTRTGPTEWTIVGTVTSSGKSTTQTAKNERLKVQPWAYNTVECYGCDGCSTYPTKPLTFTKNKLYQSGKEIEFNQGSLWQINPQPAEKLMCHEKTTVAANGDTTVTFV